MCIATSINVVGFLSLELIRDKTVWVTVTEFVIWV